MQRLVEALWARHRLSVLIITHDVDEAILLADRALVIERGRLVANIEIDLPRPREVGQPGFVALRKKLLNAIGVVDESSETALFMANAAPDSTRFPAPKSRIALA
jgi:sulfonate transport system ATP-binding protein